MTCSLQVSTEFCVEYERMECCVIQRDWELQCVSHLPPLPLFLSLFICMFF